MARLFFKPDQAFAGDFIPLYADGRFHLFYLKDYRNGEDCGEGTPWFHIATCDFVNFEDLGEALPRGAADQQDLYVFTGSAVRAEGRYHIFYTGHNPHLMRRGQPQEAVLHAVSDDLIAWAKTDEPGLFAPAEGYERDDWRDPFVYYDAERGEYRMLLAARCDAGASRRRGVTACMSSKDLKSWKLEPPMWAPGLYFTHECPDYFRMGEYEYLIFSEFSQSSRTRYVMRRVGAQDWRQAADDCFDGRAYYAAKTASDGERRYVFGWIPTRAGERDDGGWQWGGCLNVHEVCQRADGTLCVKEPEVLKSAFGAPETPAARPLFNVHTAAALELNGAGGSAGCAYDDMPREFRLEIGMTGAAEAGSVSVMLSADRQLECGHELRLDFGMGRMVWDRWPRPGDVPYCIGLDRPINARSEHHKLSIVVDGTAGCAYLDDDVALSFRLYERFGSSAGIIARDRDITIDYVKLSRLR